MHNSIPYVTLVLICVPLLVWIIWHKREPGLIGVFLTYVGIIYVIEYCILVLFDSYRYKPHFLTVHYYDNIMGAVISDLVTVPTLALLIAAFQLNFVWICLIALSFSGIERLFVYLGVYELHWWKVSYTMIIFALFFWLARWWIRKIRERYYPVMHFVSLFLLSFTIMSTAIFFTGVFNFFNYRIGVFQEPYRDSVFVAGLVCAVDALVFAAIQFFHGKNLLWNATIPACSLLCQYLLWKANILRILIPYGLFFTIIAICCIVVVGLAIFINRWLINMMPRKGEVS